VHRCCQNVIKRTRAPAGREKEREGRVREGGKGRSRALSQVKYRHARLTRHICPSQYTGYGYALRAAQSEYRL